jgi:hypothetical protein
VIRFKPSALKETRCHEYVVRFVLGGFATVVAGIIAGHLGPETGGLFLAFPAIFCASATLIEKHERERKEKKGLRGSARASRSPSSLVFCGERPALAPRSRSCWPRSLG